MWWFPFKNSKCASRHQGGGDSHNLTCWSIDENTAVSTLTRIVGRLPTAPTEEQRLLLARRSLRGTKSLRNAEEESDVDVSMRNDLIWEGPQSTGGLAGWQSPSEPKVGASPGLILLRLVIPLSWLVPPRGRCTNLGFYLGVIYGPGSRGIAHSYLLFSERRFLLIAVGVSPKLILVARLARE
jgi:hypothetical protein